MTWDEVLESVEDWLEVTFVLNSPRDKVVWMGVIGFAARLEYLAAAVLWVKDGQPETFEGFQEGMTLGRALSKPTLASALSKETLAKLRSIWDLRNAVAHSSATYGLSAPQPSLAARRLPEYEGRNVFTDCDGFAAFRLDVDDAIREIIGWLKANLVGGTFT